MLGVVYFTSTLCVSRLRHKYIGSGTDLAIKLKATPESSFASGCVLIKNFIFISRVSELLGYTAEELTGKNLYALCHGEDANKLRKCHVDCK